MSEAQEIAPVLELDGVTRRFEAPDGAGKNEVLALSSISLELRPGQVMGVVGTSGCGKTTLARIAADLLPPTAGSVRIAGIDPSIAGSAERKSIRRDVRVIFQSPSAALNPFLRARELLEEPLQVHCPRLSRGDRRRRVEELAGELGFDTGRLDQYPHTLSGGEKRRASLVRALLVRSRLIIADEPTSGLDASLEARVLRAVRDRCDRWNAALLLISHHLGIVEAHAEEIMVLDFGKEIERLKKIDGRFPPPIHPKTRELWAAAQL